MTDNIRRAAEAALDWFQRVPIAELEAVEAALEENAPIAMLTEALEERSVGKDVAMNSETRSFSVTAYAVYAVRIEVEAATPQEAIDKACEAVDWHAPERTGLPGAKWAQFSDGWQCFSASGGEGVQWFGPDGASPLPNEGSRLIIEGVDLELLEAQRLSLGKAMVRAGSRGLHLTPDEALALTGVVYMLDAWSDGRAKESIGRA